MKINKLSVVDVLPSICGVVVVLDFLLFNGDLFSAVRPITLAFAITPALAAISLTLSALKHRPFNFIHVLNILWLIFGLLVVGYFIVFKLTYTS